MHSLSSPSFRRNIECAKPSTVKFGNQSVNENSQLQAVAAMQNDILVLRSPYTSQAERTKASTDLKSQNNRSRMLNLLIDQEKRQESKAEDDKRRTTVQEEQRKQSTEAAEEKERSEKAAQEEKEKQKAEAAAATEREEQKKLAASKDTK
jgi:hypothetical protein